MPNLGSSNSAADKNLMSTRCVCAALIPLKHPSFGKHDPDI